MLHLLNPGQAESRTRIAIQDPPIQLPEKLSVGRVPTVERNEQRLSLGSEHVVVSDSPGLISARHDGRRDDSDAGECRSQFIARGEAVRRPPPQVDRRGHAPTDRHASEHIGWKAMTGDHRREDRQEHDEFDHALDGPRQIRKSSCGDSDGQADM